MHVFGLGHLRQVSRIVSFRVSLQIRSRAIANFVDLRACLMLKIIEVVVCVVHFVHRHLHLVVGLLLGRFRVEEIISRFCI